MKRPCPHCRTLVEASEWAAHQQAHKNAGKASTTARGYGAAHQRVRREWAKRIAAGGVVCARFQLGQCLLADRPEGPVILPGEEWEPDHVDGDKSQYLGPSHLGCNRATAGRA